MRSSARQSKSMPIDLEPKKSTPGAATIDGVSVVIPTYNRSELLAKAIASVQELRIPQGLNAELVIIDNNSPDDTPAIVAAAAENAPFPVRYVVETKQGLNHARNRCIQAAAYEHIVFLDDDMLVNPDWLVGYMEAQERYQPSCVIGPVHPMFEVDLPDWLTASMYRSVAGTYSLKGDEMALVSADVAHQLPGCNFSVLRTAAVEAGGFHPDLDRSGTGMLGGGDWEFGERIVKLGRRVVYAPKCGIRHFVSGQKVSRNGLRARWQGMGASERARMALRGQRVSLRRRAKALWWMSRCLVTALAYRLIGDEVNAFHWELQGLLHRGFLFKAPAVEQRQWPPATLDVGTDD